MTLNNIRSYDPEQIHGALESFGGNRSQTAQFLKVSRSALNRWIRSNTKVSADQAEARQLENKIAKLRGELSAERKKRDEAEKELNKTRDSLEAITHARESSAPRVISRGKKGKPSGEDSALLLLSDWHLDEAIDPESVNGVNAFNWEIAERRIERLWNKAVYLLDFVRNISNLSELVVWFGGDFISGQIHPELDEVSDVGAAQSLLRFQDHAISGLEFLSRETGLPIHCICNTGNHSRTTREIRHSTFNRHSYEFLAYHNIRHALRGNSSISFLIPEGYMAIAHMQNMKVRFHHGHGGTKYRGAMGGPLAGIRRSIGQWDKIERCDLTVQGHLHTFMDDHAAVINGCLCGYSPFALSMACDIQPPSQSFLVISRDYGKVLNMPIWLEKKS